MNSGVHDQIPTLDKWHCERWGMPIKGINTAADNLVAASDNEPVIRPSVCTTQCLNIPERYETLYQLCWLIPYSITPHCKANLTMRV